MIAYLDSEDLLAIAGEILGVEPTVRDIGLLDSAAHRPRAAMFGQEAYSTIHVKAAALADSIVRNHALVDGNKRLGFAPGRGRRRLAHGAAQPLERLPVRLGHGGEQAVGRGQQAPAHLGRAGSEDADVLDPTDRDRSLRLGAPRGAAAPDEASV